MTPTDRDSAIAQAIAALDIGRNYADYFFERNGRSSAAKNDVATITAALASLRVLAPAPAPFAFQIGATVFKHRGSYRLHGTVRAHFITKDGDPRYVVDHEPTVPGLLHIYNEEQLMAAAPADQRDAGRDAVIEDGK